MKKKKGLIFFICLLFLFFTPLAMALDNDIFSETDQPESIIEELSSKIESSLPYISREDAAELAEVLYLIRELEREIFLTNQIIELREKGKKIEVAKPEEERPSYVEVLERVGIVEEIVVAKQVSEEPEVSLPREEKSLIAELERKGIVEEIRPAPVPISRRETGVYPGKVLERDKLSVVIEKEQTILVPAAGLKRFIVTDPEKLKAERIDEKIRITGIALGRTFLHIWDSEGRRTIKVRTIRKGYEAFVRAKKRAIEAAKMESFKIRYSFDRYRINSKSVNPDRSYHYTEWFHRLAITGETPWGKTNSRLQYEGRESGGGTELKRDLTAWDFNLKGEDVEILIGDTMARFSDITLPSTGYQGIRFRNPDKKDINYDIVWGAQGNRMWGYKVEGWDTANYFWGARGEIEPADFIHFNTTFTRCLEDAEDTGEYLYAAGAGLNFLDDAIEIEGEAARSKSEETDLHNHAYKIDTTLRLKDYNLTLNGTYRDIDPDFLLVTGARTGAPHGGELGYYFDADYRPLSYLHLTGDYNIFRNRANFNPTETQRYNYDWRGTVNFNIGPATRFSYMKWKRMYEGQSSPSRGQGDSYNVSHTLSLPPLIRSMSLRFQYTPSQLRNLTSPSGDYRGKRYSCSMGLNVLKNLYYDISHTWHYRKMLNKDSDESGTARVLSTGLRYSRRILNTPFYSSLSLRCHKEYDVMENISLTAGEDVVTGEGEIKYRPSAGFETYLRVNYQHIRGVLDHSRNRQEMRIYGGGSYLFDTTLRWGGGGSIRGFVFKDLNGNGMKEPDEGGLSGINVYVGELYSTVTDADGKFEFRRVKDYEISVMFDTKMLPEGYECTTPNPQTIKLERGLVTEVYFGVMPVAEISGIVFNDVNMNKIFDNGDVGIRNILLTLDDGTMTQTTARGHYRMEDVKARRAILTLDTITLPPNLLPLTTIKRTIEVKEGEYYEEDFPLYALRTIVGTVFIDENGNGKFDSGEQGVEDVVLRCAGVTAITDSNGRYFLKKLPDRTQELILDVESIPPGYELSVEPSRAVKLLPEGEIKEDVDFPLRRR